MCKIWANELLPKALKRCPKSNKSPNLVTLNCRVHSLKLYKYGRTKYHFAKSVGGGGAASASSDDDDL